MSHQTQEAPAREPRYAEEGQLDRIVQRTRERDLLSLPEEERKGLWNYAQLAVKGGFSGRHKSAESAYCAILYGLECGLSINQALQNVYVVNGRASMEVKSKCAIIAARGHRPPRAAIVGSEGKEKAVAKCWREGEEYVAEFTIEQAKAAGLTGKDSWKFYWRDMLRWRALDRAIEEAFPDLTKGMGSAEIMRDVNTDILMRDMQDVDPEKVREAMQAKAPEPEKPKKKRGRPRKKETKEEHVERVKEETGLSDENLTAPEMAKVSQPGDHLPGDEPEAEREPGADDDEVDNEWLWAEWKKASENLSGSQIRKIKAQVLQGEDKLFISQDLTAEQIELAVKLAKEGV